MNRYHTIMLVIIALSLAFVAEGCKSKEKQCKDQAKMDCFGEATQGRAKKDKGGQEYSCFDARFAACLGRD
jgi:hypothetical protein